MPTTVARRYCQGHAYISLLYLPVYECFGWTLKGIRLLSFLFFCHSVFVAHSLVRINGDKFEHFSYARNTVYQVRSMPML